MYNLTKNTFLFIFLVSIFWGACSFDYGGTLTDGEDQPDIIMDDVSYVRVRDGEPEVRFQAESAERYEERQTMELRDFSFEQFDNHDGDVNAKGQAGAASVELDSGNIRMEGGVRIAVDSEDITIETTDLAWQDKERILSGGENTAVNIRRSDGTSFSGRGFSANVRDKTWIFAAGAGGTYIHEDEDEDDNDDNDDGSETLPEGEEPAAEEEAISLHE
jgi:LPS export ABC transporter protein LptC